MTITELRQIYEAGTEKREIFLRDSRSGGGFQIKNKEQFDSAISILGEEAYILNELSNKELIMFDFFTLGRSKPHCVVLRHPYMANAYWKELPDDVIDMFAAPGGFYNYIKVNYHAGLYDLVIEMPQAIDKPIAKLCHTVFPDFYTKNKTDVTTSIVFTNTSRFRDLSRGAFFLFELDELALDIKRPTPLKTSRALWKKLKEFRVEHAE